MDELHLITPLVTLVIGAFCTFLWLRASSKTDVLFFPDAKNPCNSFYRQLGILPQQKYPYVCRNPHCPYAHNVKGEITSLMEIFNSLKEAKKKIDLCVFDFTHTQLAEFVKSAHVRGVIRVRIITDVHLDRRQSNNNDSGDQSRQQGINDQIPGLHNEGIEVKINSCNVDQLSKMHNKFVLIDDKCLLMGSFNWTHSAVTRNHEAVIRTKESRVVRKFVRKFNEIWKSSRPYVPR